MSVQVTVWPRGIQRVKVSGPLGITFNSVSKTVPRPVFMSDIGRLTSVQASTRYEDGFGGHDLASWTIVPLGGYVGGMIRPGDHCRVTKGGGTVWEGEIAEVVPGDDGTVTLHGRGYAYNLFDYDSIYWKQIVGDDIYYPTTQLTGGTLTDSWRGWEYATEVLGMPINQVVGTVTGWSSPIGESDIAEGPVKLGEVITALHREDNERWAVWGRTLVIAADDMTPIWAYDAPDGVVGVADTDYATHVFVWFVATGPATWNVATAYTVGQVVEYGAQWWKALVGNTGVTPVEGSTWAEQPVQRKKSDFSMVVAADTGGHINRFDVRTAVADYRGLGLMASSRAQSLAQSLLDQVKGRFIVSGSFTVGPKSGFKSANGGAVDIAFVRAGRAMRLTGLRTSQGSLMSDGDVHMIGKTEWSWDEGGNEQLTVTPMGAVARSLGDILRGSPLDAGSIVAGSTR